MVDIETIQDIGRLEGEIVGIHKELSTLNRILLGNGQSGLQERLIHSEEVQKQLIENQTINVKAISDLNETIKNTNVMLKESTDNLTKSIVELQEIIKDHIKDKSVHSFTGLFLKKDIIIYVALAFLILHSFIPQELNLWNIISKFLGF